MVESDALSLINRSLSAVRSSSSPVFDAKAFKDLRHVFLAVRYGKRATPSAYSEIHPASVALHHEPLNPQFRTLQQSSPARPVVHACIRSWLLPSLMQPQSFEAVRWSALRLQAVFQLALTAFAALHL